MPGEFWRGATATGLAHGLRAHGHCVTPVDIASYLPTKGNRAARALFRLTQGVAGAAYNRAILRLAEQAVAVGPAPYKSIVKCFAQSAHADHNM